MRAALRFRITKDRWCIVERQSLPTQNRLYIFCGFSEQTMKWNYCHFVPHRGHGDQRFIFPLSSFSLFLLCPKGTETVQLINLPHSHGATLTWKPSRFRTPSSRHHLERLPSHADISP